MGMDCLNRYVCVKEELFMAVISRLIGRDELNANALKEFGIDF